MLAYLDPAAVWIGGRAGGGLAVESDGFVSVNPSPSIDSITDQVTIAGWGYLEGTIIDYATIASRETGTTIDQHYHISINSRGEVPALWLNTETGTMLLQGPTRRRAPNVDPHRRHLRRDDGPPLRRRPAGGDPAAHRPLRAGHDALHPGR